MEDWIAMIAIVACLLPPAVLGALPPRTEKWRRARRMFWITSALGAVLIVAAVASVKVFGGGVLVEPPALMYGALFVFVTVMGLWCYAAGIVRSEWSEWRDQRRKQAEPVASVPQPDPTKPWKK